MFPGYRPDTVLIQNLPLRWFSKDENLKTNWLIGAFSTFGDIRRFHIPLLDEFEKAKASKSDESEGFKKFNFNSEHQTFDVYLMYKDYVGFVNAMDGLRGMKLVKCRKDENFKTVYIEHEIKLDFDKSKHLSDKAIRRRQIAKKYGINTLEDLNEYKKKAKERKALYEQRMKQLKRHKKSSRNLLDFLARLVAVEQKKREQEELQALNERLLKERLLEEEKKLRNKLIERQRTLMMEKLKEQGKLAAKDSNGSIENHHQHSHGAYDRPDYPDDHYREHSDRHANAFGHSDHRSVPNRYERYDDYAASRKPDFVFKYPRIHPHFNPNFGPPHGKQTNHFNIHFNGHPNSFHPNQTTPHYPNNPQRTSRGANFRPHYQPYEANANNRNTFAYSKKSNYYDDYPEQYAERLPTRHDYHSQRPGERFDRPDRYPTGHRERSGSFPERAGAYPADKSDYRERSGSYQNRPGNPERGNYQTRSNYQERGNYPMNHPDRASYQERSDYRDRAQNYERPYDRSNSFNRPAYRVREEEEDSRSEEKSSTRPKSLVVLPQK